MIGMVFAAAQQIFSSPFRAVFWKTLGLTLLLLAALWVTIEKLVVTLVHPSQAWLATGLHVVAGVGLVVGIVFLVTPISFAVASVFFDELADHVEETIGSRGTAMALGPALWIGAKFAGVGLLVNLVALALLLVPGINLVAFFGANAYLLGRGFFELAALRHVPVETMREIRRDNGLRLFIAGCLPAGLSLVPILNLLTPLFAAALMVRVAAPLIRQRLALPQG